MSVIDWALVLVWAAAVPQTVFIVGYGFLNDWWTSWVGRALFTSSLALALLLDVSLVSYYYPDLIPAWVSNIILVVVVAGAFLKLTALTLDKLAKRSWRG